MTSKSSETPGRQRRRRFEPAFKRAIVEQTLVPGVSVARVARAHDINANQLFKWRRQLLLEQPPTPKPAASAPSTLSLLPVTVVAEGLESDASPSPAPPSPPGQIEITLAGGTVRVQGAVDSATLQLVLSSLRR